MSHITWSTTGALTFLPIHAAGTHDANDQPKVFDYVISSYSPTLTALLSTERHPPESTQKFRLLTVSQPATPHQKRLPGTLYAIQTLQSQTDRLRITRLDDHKATVAAVLQSMKECNWVHLACHGVQDDTSATDSAFLLIDGPLTLKEIMKQSFSHTELAVLSACQTAAGDKKIARGSDPYGCRNANDWLSERCGLSETMTLR
jgi:CHAT domain-containing protein